MRLKDMMGKSEHQIASALDAWLSGPPTSLESLRHEVEAHESKHGMPAHVMRDLVAQGLAEGASEVCDWIMAADLLAQATPTA